MAGLKEPHQRPDTAACLLACSKLLHDWTKEERLGLPRTGAANHVCVYIVVKGEEACKVNTAWLNLSGILISAVSLVGGQATQSVWPLAPISAATSSNRISANTCNDV